jgi:hypothetical protein
VDRLTLDQVPWAVEQLWAPDLIEGRDGRYHLLFPAKDVSGSFRLGAAHASRPEGPYVADPEPLTGSCSIDPSVAIDAHDGQAYVFFGGLQGGQLERCMDATSDGSARGPLAAPLHPSMNAFDGPVREVVIMDPRTGAALTEEDEERRFFEGAQVYQRGSTWYLLYSTGTSHRIVYATSDAPLGPYAYRGAILGPVDGWTTHGSAVEWRGDWYYLHHDSACSFGDTARRCVKVAHMQYADTAADGVSTSAADGSAARGSPARYAAIMPIIKGATWQPAAGSWPPEPPPEPPAEPPRPALPVPSPSALATVVLNGRTRVTERGEPLNAHQGSLVQDRHSGRVFLYGNYQRDCISMVRCHCVGADAGWTVTSGVGIYSAPSVAGPWRYEAGPVLAPFNQPRVVGPIAIAGGASSPTSDTAQVQWRMYMQVRDVVGRTPAPRTPPLGPRSP